MCVVWAIKAGFTRLTPSFCSDDTTGVWWLSAEPERFSPFPQEHLVSAPLVLLKSCDAILNDQSNHRQISV